MNEEKLRQLLEKEFGGVRLDIDGNVIETATFLLSKRDVDHLVDEIISLSEGK